MRKSHELGATAQVLLKPSGYLHRSYYAPDGTQVNVAVILGAHGPISVHTPEVCYDSRDFTALGQREAVTLKDSAGNEAEFWKLTFRSTTVDQAGLRVYYAWSPDADWEAVDSPRWTYFGQPYLFKIQLACAVDPESDDQEDACRRFLVDFMQQLKQQLESPNG
jgi:hypothetical protein